MSRTKRVATSESGAYMSQYDTEVETRLQALESKAHTPCQGGGASAKVDPSGLPPLAAKKGTDAITKIKALEARLEALIAQLS